jgi:hypothetical protein
MSFMFKFYNKKLSKGKFYLNVDMSYLTIDIR